jgi:hypothetical protein
MEAKDFIATYLTGHVMEVMSPRIERALNCLAIVFAPPEDSLSQRLSIGMPSP